MEMVLNNEFSEIAFDEMLEIDGGGWKQFGQVFLGTILVSWSPVVGIGGGIIAAGTTFGIGLSLIGAGTH